MANNENTPDTSRQERNARYLLSSLFSGRLKDGQQERIRAWLVEEEDREVKEDALSVIYQAQLTESDTVSRKTAGDLANLKQWLGLPVIEYPERNGRVIVPDTLPQEHNTIPLYRRMGFRIAAVLVPMIVVGATGLFLLTKGSHSGHSLAHEISVAAGGETRNILLPDSSRVILTEGTLLYNDDFGNERVVELEGKAYFNVLKDGEGKRFMVKTKQLNISVLGTEFRVHCPAGEDHSMIDLHHGSIQVSAAGKDYELKSGQYLHHVHSTGQSKLSETALTDRVYETMPNLKFDGSSLAEIFEVLEREYRISIEIRCQLSNDNDIRANLTNARSIDEVMSRLSLITDNFRYRITEDRVIISSDNSI